MPYCHLFYHFVWATKNRERRITTEVEPILYGFLRAKVINLGGTIFALNGDEDHTHMVSTFPPRIAVADFIGQAKGATSAQYNSKVNQGEPFYWQEDYGVFSIDGKRLPNVIAYVENQKQHHRQPEMLIPILERTDDERPYAFKESKAQYFVETDEWRREMLALDNE